MKGFIQNIETLTTGNQDFRRVLYTSKNCQIVLMSLKPKEEIGAETHTLDQFFRVEDGYGEAILDGVSTAIKPGFAVLGPGRGFAQHRQFGYGADETVHDLCPPESPGRRRPPHPRRCRKGRRAL